MATSFAQRGTGVADASRWLLWASIASVAVAFVVRLPGMVEPMGPDQGVYATAGWGLQRGLALYRELWELKPPGIYLTYALGFTLFGTQPTSIFWLDYLAALLTAVLLFDIGRRLVSPRFGALAAAVFALATLPAARQSLGGFVERAVTETFIAPLAAAAAWATVVAITRKRDLWSFLAGLFVGVALVFKPTALVYWPALVLWTWLAADTSRARRFAIWSSIGIPIAPIMTIVWLWQQGSLRDAWIVLAEYDAAFLASGGQGLAGVLNLFAHEVWRRMKTDEVWALGSLSGLIALSAWRRRSTAPGLVAMLGVLWVGAAMVAVVGNGQRLFTTHFIPPLVPISLLIAWLFDQVFESWPRRRFSAGILLLAFTGGMLMRSGSINRAVGMTSWDTRHLAGMTDRENYLQRFRSRASRAFSAADNARLAEYVRTHTDPRDRIFVFGMTGGTYFLSGRLPASRYLFVYPAVSNLIDRPEFRVESLAGELARNAPRYIVLQRYSGDSLSGWRVEDSFAEPPMVALLRDYRQETEIGVFVLYRRDDGHP